MHIAIEGCIGAGKTTLAKALAAGFNGRLLCEDTSLNPYLPAFYSGDRDIMLETELSFLLAHYHQLKGLDAMPLVISDFTIEKDLLFAKLNLSDHDLECFTRLYNSLQGRLKAPDYVVLLDASPDACLSRVKARGINHESSISTSYLAQLKELYEKHFSNSTQATVVKVDASKTAVELAYEVSQLVSSTFNLPNGQV